MRSTLLRGAAAGALALATTALSPPSAVGAVTTPFVVSHDGSEYRAENAGVPATYTGSLKSVVQKAVAYLDDNGGGTIQFTAGDFDLGGEWLILRSVDDVEFAGAGMSDTVIRNATDVAADSEPFSFHGAFGVTVRDLTVQAGGAPRSTSDALDFDGGNDVVVEDVRVTLSRGRGIIFDGKDAGRASARNRVTGCEISGTAGDGIELLASTDNVVENCTITDVGGHGIQLAKSSSSADQPNKPSSRNAIRNNTISHAGADGINFNGGSGNLVVGNRITSSSHNGIRLGTGEGIHCDDNAVRGNVATDTQETKTQGYGLNIASSLCHRTVVGADNDFDGNRVGDVNDLGTGTIFEGEVPNRRPEAEDLSMIATPAVTEQWTPADTDPDGDTLQCFLTTQGTKGTATVERDCSLGTYVAETGQRGTDSFEYRVFDGILSDTGTVTVTITPANTPPVAGDLTITTTEGASKPWTPAVSDVDGDSLTCSITTPGTKGAASVTSSCTSGGYEPAAGMTGADSFVYTVSDGPATDTGTVSVTINASAPPPPPTNNPPPTDQPPSSPPASNQGPVAGDLSITTTEGASKAWTPRVSDADADTLTCSITSQGTKGAASVTSSCASGGYAPAAGMTGADSFVYTVSDGKATDTGTVSVTINAVVGLQTAVKRLAPVADTFVKRSAPRSSFGLMKVLRVGTQPRTRSYLRFRVPELAGDVRSVQLRIFVGRSGTAGGMSVREARTAWREDRLTWNRSPWIGDRVARVANVTPGGWLVVDLPVAAVSGGQAVAWALTPRRGAELRLRSGESGKAPRLVIVTQ